MNIKKEKSRYAQHSEILKQLKILKAPKEYWYALLVCIFKPIKEDETMTADVGLRDMGISPDFRNKHTKKEETI